MVRYFRRLGWCVAAVLIAVWFTLAFGAPPTNSSSQSRWSRQAGHWSATLSRRPAQDEDDHGDSSACSPDDDESDDDDAVDIPLFASVPKHTSQPAVRRGERAPSFP